MNSTIVTVDFRGDQLLGFEREDGIYIALKPIVEAMGLDWSSQLKRLKRDPILAEGMVMMTTPFGRSSGQDAVCLNLRLVNGWLFTIESSRIKDEEKRRAVIEYQRNCYDALYKKFYGKHEKPSAELEASEATAGHVRQVTEARQTFGPKAAGQLWFKLGLPVVPAMLENPDQSELFDFSKIKTIEGQAA